MSLRPLDFDFPLMSDLSARPPHAVPVDEQSIELNETTHERRTTWPSLIRKGRLTQEEANRHATIWRHIADDLAQPPADASPAGQLRHWNEWRDRRAGTEVSWDDKIRELRRELAIRRNRYPQQIARLTHDEADLRIRLERLDALHWAYWMELQYLHPFVGETLAERSAPAARMIAERTHRLVAMIDAGDRAVAGIATFGSSDVFKLVAWYRAGGRDELLERYPDVRPPALDKAA